MAIDVKQIGTFGLSFSRGLDQTWFNLWRKEDGFSMDLYEMVENDDPDADDEIIDTKKRISLELGDSILRNALEKGCLEEWKLRYLKDDEGIDSELNWTIDIDDTENNDLLLLSGNWKLPPNGWMTEVIKAIREGEENFAKCFKEFP